MTNGSVNHTEADAGVPPEKIGGWLYFPAIGLIVGCITRTIYVSIVAFLVPFFVHDAYRANAHKLLEILLAYVASEALLLAFLAYTTVRFFRKKRNAPNAATAMLIAQVVVYGLLIALFIAADADYTITRNVPGLAKGSLIAFAGSVLAAALWIPYFRISKRVKKTFVLD